MSRFDDAQWWAKASGEKKKKPLNEQFSLIFFSRASSSSFPLLQFGLSASAGSCCGIGGGGAVTLWWRVRVCVCGVSWKTRLNGGGSAIRGASVASQSNLREN